MTHITLTTDKNNTQGLNIDSTLMVSGEVTITNGDTHIVAKNKICSGLLMNLSNIVGSYNMSANAFTYNFAPSENGIIIGYDTVTPTTARTTQLTGPTTQRNPFIYGATSQNGNDYLLTVTAMFNPGQVSGVCGEIGLFYASSASQTATASRTAPGRSANILWARLASADGEFTSFTINPVKPLVIVWTLKFTSDGKFLNWGAVSFVNFLTNAWTGGSPNMMAFGFAEKTTWMCLGSNTTTVNNLATTAALVTPFGTIPGTKATLQLVSLANPVPGTYTVSFSATWNAGTLTSGTIGEIGLYLNGTEGTQSANLLRGFGHTASATSDYTKLMARLSVADGHIQPVSINAALPVTVVWTMTFQFA